MDLRGWDHYDIRGAKMDRFNSTYDGMEEHPEGEWVAFEDVSRIEETLKEAIAYVITSDDVIAEDRKTILTLRTALHAVMEHPVMRSHSCCDELYLIAKKALSIPPFGAE